MNRLSPDQKFGRLTVKGEGVGTAKHPRVICICECGREKAVRVDHLISGATTSCGCFAVEHARERNLKPPSQIDIVGEVALVRLAHGKSATIDAADVPRVEGRHWCFSGGYVFAYLPKGSRPRYEFLHVLIGAPASGQQVDHWDRDRLNNRRNNLRPCSHAQNIQNQKVRSDNRLGLKGVTRTRSGRFRAAIRKGDQRFHIGVYDTPQEAHAAYVERARELFGEFARAA